MAAGGRDHRTPDRPGTEAPGTLGTVPVGRCESCGDVEVELTLVRRLYVTPESWDTPYRVEPGGREMWCFVCRTHYPHQELDAEGEPIGEPAPPSG